MFTVASIMALQEASSSLCASRLEMASGVLTTSLRSNSFSAQLVNWQRIRHCAIEPDLLPGHDAKNIQDDPFALWGRGDKAMSSAKFGIVCALRG